MSQSVYIDRKDIQIKSEGNVLVFYTSQGRGSTMPFRLIDRLVIRGHCNMDVQLLGKLAQNNITTTILGARHSDALAVIPAKKHNDASIRLCQYYVVQHKQLALVAAQQLIHAKLLRQKRFINELAGHRHDKRRYMVSASKQISEMLSKVSKVDNKPSLLGIEGAAAKSYFSALTQVFAPSLDFNGRNKRPPRDPVNSVLSFSYTLFYSRCVQALNIVGLDPMIGFYHELDYGRYSLASDMIEPWRPAIDRFVWHLFTDRIFNDSDFDHFENDACFLNKKGRQKFYPVFEMAMQQWHKGLRRLARYFVKQVRLQGSHYVK